MKVFLVLAVLSISTMGKSSNILSAEMCQCNNITQTEVLQFEDKECDQEQNTESREEITYFVFTDKAVPVPVIGTACSTWIRRKVVQTSWLGDQDFIFTTIPLDTTPEMCKEMAATSKCGENFMIRTGEGKFSFTNEPLGGNIRGNTVTVDLLNCATQTILLGHPCPDCELQTPVGPVAINKGHASAGHVTVIWDKDVQNNASCQRRLLENGYAYMTTDVKNTTRRIIDVEKQLDLHIEYNSTIDGCDPPYETKGNRVINNLEWYVLWGLADLTSAPVDRHHFPSVRGDPAPPHARPHSRKTRQTEQGNSTNTRATEDEKRQFDKVAHAQHQADMEISISNELSREIRSLQCQSRKARHAQAVATANFNPWLAGQQLNLPQCTRLITAGEFIIAQQCEVVTIPFHTIVGECGPQLRYENFTVSPNGCELIPLTNCSTSTQIVHVAGKAYKYNGVEWEKITPKQVLVQEELSHQFKYPTDNSFQYQILNKGQRPPAVDIINQYTQLAVERFKYETASEEKIKTESIFYSASKTAGPWDTFIFWALVTSAIVVFLLILRLFQMCGVTKMIQNIVLLACCYCFKTKKQKENIDPIVMTMS